MATKQPALATAPTAGPTASSNPSKALVPPQPIKASFSVPVPGPTSSTTLPSEPPASTKREISSNSNLDELMDNIFAERPATRGPLTSTTAGLAAVTSPPRPVIPATAAATAAAVTALPPQTMPASSASLPPSSRASATAPPATSFKGHHEGADDDDDDDAWLAEQAAQLAAAQSLLTKK